MPSERVQRQIERILDEAEQALGKYDWEALKQHSEAVLALDPENEDARTFLDAALRSLGVVDAMSLVIEQPSATESPHEQQSEQPTSFANGRYTITKFLGEGGKKRVYLAQDTLLDRQVAFALIRTEGLDDISRTRISREAQAMGRLGSHPHIVTVFDLGDHEGQPFMVTELMGGGDVEAIIEDAPEHRLPLEQAIRIATETCRGLEFAHGRGIVHRDLKPGNVWLTEDGTAKIGDFGLAVATDRSRLTQEGMMVGTVSYMPPEQAMGGETTAQADLYSLGAMLYEMVAGRPPFLGDDSVAIIGQHINTPPVAPTWHRSECPKPLEALILRLLAKNPAERPESASDVLTALGGIDLSITPVPTDSDETEANALDSLAGGVFVGRHAEMGELKAALEDALSGRGRMLTLVGEPGIGKTRTSQELATYANLRGAQVLWGRCYEEQGVPSYWPWVQAIRSYVAEREPEELASVMGAGAADIAEIVSDVKQRLPGLQPPPALDSPEEARFRLFDSITSFLKNASRVQPIMLVLDDLHWADKPSLMLLQFVTRELSGTRLLLMGTYRDVELNRQHPLAETLGDLTRERLFQRILLRGLTQDDVGRFIEATSGINPPAGLVGAVHTQTEGNPLFVTEVVRLLVQEGELTGDKVGERESWTVRIPEGVREVIGRRLNQLSQRCNETLTIASVIGREFELRQLDRLVEDQTEDMLLDVLEEGLNARVIDELQTSVGRYQFTHALIQETLSEELSLTRRVRLHARIAETLEALYGADVEAHAAELAHHFAQGEAVVGSEKLVKYSLQAGQQALSDFAYEEAQTYFERGLAARELSVTNTEQSSDVVAADLLFGLSRSQMATRGWRSEAMGNLVQAFNLYEQAGDIENAVTVASFPSYMTVSNGHGTNMMDVIERAFKLVPENSPKAGLLWARLSRLLGLSKMDYKASSEALEKALLIARRENDAGLELLALDVGVGIDPHHLRLEECVEKGQRILDLSKEVDIPLHSLLHTHSYLTVNYIFLGNNQMAKQHAQACLDLLDKYIVFSDLVNSLYVNQLLAHLEGSLKLALEYAEQAVSAGASVLNLGINALTELELGRTDDGRLIVEEFVNTIRKSPPNDGFMSAVRALVIALAARLTDNSNWFDAAELAATAILSSPNPISPQSHLHAQMGAALISLQRNDDNAVLERHYAALESRRGIMSNMGITVVRILGLLAHTMGKLDDAQTHFEDALTFCRKAGYRPELAWSLCDYADMLLERNGEGDRQKAMQLLDESLQISTELGMRPLMERVLSRREILKA